MGFDSRLVVTGGRGQLGRALQALKPEGLYIDIDDVDLTNTAEVVRVISDLRATGIIHAGAYTAVDAAENDREGAWAVNVGGTRAVVEAARATGAVMAYVSTDYVFTGDRAEPYPEEHPTGPLSYYGLTKLWGEEAVATLDRHLIVRTSWVYGEGKNFVRAILGAARNRPGQELTVVDDQRGRPTYAVDLAGGILALLGRRAAGTYHLQNSGEAATWADVAEAALGAAGLDSAVRRVSTAAYNEGRPGPIAARPANGVLDCSKAAALGVELRPWRDALAEYVKVMA